MTESWTKPYHGVQHFPAGQPFSLRSHWLTVEDHGTFANLFMWYPGCSCNPKRSSYSTVEGARSAGERWLGEIRVRGYE